MHTVFNIILLINHQFDSHKIYNINLMVNVDITFITKKIIKYKK